MIALVLDTTGDQLAEPSGTAPDDPSALRPPTPRWLEVRLRARAARRGCVCGDALETSCVWLEDVDGTAVLSPLVIHAAASCPALGGADVRATLTEIERRKR